MWAEEPEKVLGQTVSRGLSSSDTGGFDDVKLNLNTSHKSPFTTYFCGSPIKPKTHLNLENLLPFTFAFSLYGLGSLLRWRTPFNLKSQANETEVTKGPAKGKGKGEGYQLWKRKLISNIRRSISQNSQ